MNENDKTFSTIEMGFMKSKFVIFSDPDPLHQEETIFNLQLQELINQMRREQLGFIIGSQQK